MSCRCPVIGSPPPQKSLPRPTIYLPAPPSAARAGWIFTGKLSTGETFLEGDPISARLFYGAGDILIMERNTNSVIISSWADFHEGDILMWHQLYWPMLHHTVIVFVLSVTVRSIWRTARWLLHTAGSRLYSLAKPIGITRPMVSRSKLDNLAVPS